MTIFTQTGLSKESRNEKKFRKIVERFVRFFSEGPTAPRTSQKMIDEKRKNPNRSKSRFYRSAVKIQGLFDFQARTEEEMSFNAEQILLLVDDSRIKIIFFARIRRFSLFQIPSGGKRRTMAKRVLFRQIMLKF